jgi:hypothetical protein
MYPVYFLAFAIILGIFQIVFLKVPFIQSFLLAFVISNVGLQGIYSFLGHFFRSDQVADEIGWPKGNLFQKEVAFTNLSLGVLGILCIWLDGNFLLATIIARSVFTWGAAYVHYSDLKQRKNINVFNAGPVLYFDIFFPLFLLGLFVVGIIA